jgi:hypothetical protein
LGAAGLFSFLIWFFAWFVPARYARLIRTGHYVVGEIQQTRRSGWVGYRYQVADRSFRGGTSLPRAWPSPRPGERVTVFYDPPHPHESVAYEFCEFETDELPPG